MVTPSFCPHCGCKQTDLGELGQVCTDCGVAIVPGDILEASTYVSCPACERCAECHGRHLVTPEHAARIRAATRA